MVNPYNIRITNFRSIKGTVNARLDAPIVLIHGDNGVGKTSLLSALELALTADVNALKTEDPSIAKYLVHEGSEFAEIDLQKLEIDGQFGSLGKIKLEKGEISGSPMLSSDNIPFYQERCYLAQSTLGKLLQIYQYSTDNKENALTRFVQDLLGIDQLDAIIFGLHHYVSHKTRLKNLSSEYADQLKFTDKLEKIIRRYDLKIVECESIAKSLLGKIKQLSHEPLYDQIQNVESINSLRDFSVAVERELSQNQYEHLETALRSLTELRSYWTNSRSNKSVKKFDELSTAVESNQSEYKNWIGGEGSFLQVIEVTLKKYQIEHDTSANILPSELFEVGSNAFNVIERQLNSTLNKHRRKLTVLKKEQSNLNKNITNLKKLDSQILDLKSKMPPKEQLLAELLNHLEGEECPVCNRDYSETSGISIRNHIQQKLSLAQKSYEELSQLELTRNELKGSITESEFELSTFKEKSEIEKDIENTLSELSEITQFKATMGSNRAQLAIGNKLKQQTISSKSQLQTLITGDARARLIREQITQTCFPLKQYNVDIVDFDVESIDDALERIIGQLEQLVISKKTISENLEAMSEPLIELERVLGMAGASKISKREFDALKVRNDNRNKSIERLRQDYLEIGKAAKLAKARIIKRVFGASLNTLWADLFKRIAVNENFVPSFEIPTDDNLTVKLETVHSSGSRGGSPGAMLSSGNLNTAALSLFLALHLTIQPKVPWLVLDDPVQLMDESHISQFAALIRLLSKQYNRKVIISVHNRALFEYLSLELSPAFEGDKLNTIELSKNKDGETIALSAQQRFSSDSVQFVA